jgi:multiple sugar transport system substrate-binding protein
MSRPIRLNLWIMPNAGFDTRRIMQRELAHFHQDNPTIEVKLTIQPWFFAWDRLVAVAKKKIVKDPPDVIQIGGTWNTTLAALGALADLTDYLDDIERTDIIRPSWNYCFEPTRSKAYSLPWFLDARVLYFRRDILKQLGMQPEQLKTWEGLREAGERLQRHVSLRKRFFGLALGGQREGILIHDLAPWIWGAGGQFISLDRKHSQFHQPEALSGIDFYYRMMVDQLIPILGRDRLSTGNFFSGQFAFQVTGSWPIHGTLDPKHPYYRADVAKNYGVTSMPAGPAGQVTYLGGSNLGIVSSSPHPDAAWKLIKFLIGVDSQLRHSRKIGMLPSRYKALEPLLSSSPNEVADVFRNSLRVARTLPCAATLGTIERILGRTSTELMDTVRDRSYTKDVLSAKMQAAAREADYVLSLYE